MMLIEKIKTDQVAARKARNSIEATLLTTLLGEAGTIAKNKQRELTTDEETVALVKKFVDRNVETQTELSKHNPHDYSSRVNDLVVEKAILDRYLPKQLSEQELGALIDAAIAGGTKPEIGPLMGYLKSGFAGQYDGKVANAVVRARLTV